MIKTYNSKIKLVCFPFGGGGASTYSEWDKLFDNTIDVFPIQLPGRERQIAEDPYIDLHKAADDFAELIKETCGGSSIAFFGHCFLGSTLAFEIIRRLESCEDINLIHLFVSAAFSPKSIRNYELDLQDDGKFIEGVEKLTGLKNLAFDIPELKELLLPSLKADFKMDMTYIPKGECSVNIPITAIFADNDSFVNISEVELWKECTTSDFNMFKVDGEHMYLTSKPEGAIEIIKNTLTKIA